MTAEPVAVRPTDAALVDRARSGDAAAFEALIGPRLDGLLRTAWAILGNRDDAEEAAQEACVSAWRELPRIRDVDRFDAWLGRVLVNHCRMSLRRRSRVPSTASMSTLAHSSSCTTSEENL